ncbi:RAP protein, putative [Plasmodium yoelii]|uniref:RAP protein n=3 Tax=Plasmodium yoelii TaxID=5861 RepID=A0AAF0B3A5_PLAYO|nr:RAP protein, putative [Plasmodium yoelii]WBY56581.1 RAP protein [Plasmodium yoelii yoelii]CDU17441.1 RAP protein, putative [Plasmodium yoelii]VTZ77158.1 RAP protein, putative [Plasmodium yoelii]|eukprot:XP_022811906.1 RAP protein, putative [Plasmodium yoelii]
MFFFVNTYLLVTYLIYAIAIILLFTQHGNANIVPKVFCKNDYKRYIYSIINKPNYQLNVKQIPTKSLNLASRSQKRRRSTSYYYIGDNNEGVGTFVRAFNKNHQFVKPNNVSGFIDYSLFREKGKEDLWRKQLKKTHSIFIKKTNKHIVDKNIDDMINENDGINEEIDESDDSEISENNLSASPHDNHFNMNGGGTIKPQESNYDLINDYILLKKNSKSIKELIKEGVWVCPKENIKMIRKRTDKKINWNYILKKNNELLKNNVDKIYDDIYDKQNVDDIFFAFDTYPFSYLNVTMSVFSLYKIAKNYLNEKRQKIDNMNGTKYNFYNLETKNSDTNDNINNYGKQSMNNFLAMDTPHNDIDDDASILKIKNERKRLYSITRNRNFMRIIGSINKHLKIIYKIFSTNNKLSTYEKNKNIYAYIPYINIKDIIIILKSFSILKYDHTNIYKYIYFYIIFFIDKFDIYSLCEAVHMCIVKNVYIKPLFQNFSKYLLQYFEKNSQHEIHPNQLATQTYPLQEKEAVISSHIQMSNSNVDHIDNTTNDSNNNEKKQIVKDSTSSNEIETMNSIIRNEEDEVRSLYDEINVEDVYKNMLDVLKKKGKKKEDKKLNKDYKNCSDMFEVFNGKNFTYSIYHSGNYSNLNSPINDTSTNEKTKKSEDLKMFSPQDKRSDKMNILQSGNFDESVSNPVKDEISVNQNTVNDNSNDCNSRSINFYVYCLYTLSKFPYTNIKLLKIITSKLSKIVEQLTIDELIISFYSLANLELDSFKLLNYLYVLIFKKLPSLNYRNTGLILKLIKALYTINNLVNVKEDVNINFNQIPEEISQMKSGVITSKNNTSINMHSVKFLMIYFVSKIILKNINNFSPIELVDVVRYLSSMDYIDKELFNFVYNLSFFKNINTETLNYYKNNIYFNQSYYAYTKDNSINTPIEIMICKLYQSYLAYRGLYTTDANNSENNTTQNITLRNDKLIKDLFEKNDQINLFVFNKDVLELFKNTYLNNMKVSSYSTSSLHYEIADIIKKDFKIPCHVEYQTGNGLLIDIAILYEDLKKVKKNIPFFKNIAIEINGPFHYKTKSLTSDFPLLNTKTILKRKLLNNEGWHVISFPFWEVKPWFTKTRKENYILKMLPEDLKSFFNEIKSS